MKNIKRVKSINTGGKHSSIVDGYGNQHVCGNTNFGILGIENLQYSEIKVFRQNEIFNDKNVIQVACGEFHTMCLLDNGQVWTWGGTLHKKTGSEIQKPGPLKSLLKHQIVQVNCGDYHSAALTAYGTLFTWGGGGDGDKGRNKGALGHGHQKDVLEPLPIKFFSKNPVKKFACGGYHMMAICQNGEVYAWGEGGMGQLGNGKDNDSTTPVRVDIRIHPRYQNLQDDYWEIIEDDFIDIIDVDCGKDHSIILAKNGYLFTCGNNSYGQLGFKVNSNLQEPTLVYSQSSKRIIKIAAGWNHSIVLDKTHSVYTTGNNKEGQQGLGDTEPRRGFTLVDGLQEKRVTHIYKGYNHTWVVLDDLNPVVRLEDYVPPSPLKSLPTTPHHNDISADDISVGGERRRPTFPDNDKSIKGLNNNKNPGFPILEENILNVVFTDNEMSHRFARLTIARQNEKIFRDLWEEFSEKISREEAGSVFNKLDEDCELFDMDSIALMGDKNKNNHPKSISMTDPNCKSFTIMLINNVAKNVEYIRDYENFCHDIQSYYSSLSPVKTPVGQMYQLKQSEINRNEFLKVQNKWFIQAIDYFEDIIKDAKFLELRPTM